MSSPIRSQSKSVVVIAWLPMPIIVGEFGRESLDTVGWYDFVRHPPPEGRRSIRTFGRLTSAADSLMVVTRGDRPEARILDARGDLVRIVRWRATPVAVTDSVRDVAEAHWRQQVSLYAEDRAAEVAAGRRENMPDVLPVLGFVMGDRDGRVWVADYAVDDRYARWWVFDVSGRSLGWVEGLPPGLNLQDAHGDLVLDVEHNDFGEAAASRFRLIDPDRGRAARRRRQSDRPNRTLGAPVPVPSAR